MNGWSPHRRSIVFVAMLRVVTAAGASAQPSPPSQATSWSAAAGYESVALRDISRTSVPVDASPVAWRGVGPAFLVAHTRKRDSRLHRIEVASTFAGDFVYRLPTRSVARPADEHYRTLEGRYEYRRAFFSNRFVRGLEADLGVQGRGSIAGFTRHLSADLEIKERIAAVGPGLVTAVRLRRWSAVGLGVDWVKGGLLARLRQAHNEAGSIGSRGGGGWFTDLTAMATIRLTSRTAFAVRYFRSGAGMIATYQNYATSRRSVVAGVTYVR